MKNFVVNKYCIYIQTLEMCVPSKFLRCDFSEIKTSRVLFQCVINSRETSADLLCSLILLDLINLLRSGLLNSVIPFHSLSTLIKIALLIFFPALKFHLTSSQMTLLISAQFYRSLWWSWQPLDVPLNFMKGWQEAMIWIGHSLNRKPLLI